MVECDNRFVVVAWTFHLLVLCFTCEACLSSDPLISTCLKKSFLRACHVRCAGGSGVRNVGKTHTNFLQRDCSTCRQTQEHNYYIPKHFTIGVPKELLLWGQSVGLFLQMGYFNGFGHRLHVRSSVHWKLTPRANTDFCIRLKLNSNSADYRLNIS